MHDLKRNRTEDTIRFGSFDKISAMQMSLK